MVDTSIPNLPVTLSVEEAAIVLQISREGVLAAVHADEITAHRLGRAYRIPTGKLIDISMTTPIANSDLKASLQIDELDGGRGAVLVSGRASQET